MFRILFGNWRFTGQIARPSADSVDGSWTPSTGTDLYAVIDEASSNDADYMFSSAGPGSDAVTVKLDTNLSTPNTGDVKITVRYRTGN